MKPDTEKCKNRGSAARQGSKGIALLMDRRCKEAVPVILAGAVHVGLIVVAGITLLKLTHLMTFAKHFTPGVVMGLMGWFLLLQFILNEAMIIFRGEKA